MPQQLSLPHSEPQPRRLSLAFWAMVFILNMPNFVWLEGSHSFLLNGAEWLERLWLGALLGSIFIALFARPWAAWLCLWALFLWWQPLALGVRLITGMPIGAPLVGIAMATSPSELRNLLSVIPWHFMVLFFVWNIAVAAAFHALLKQKHWRWTWAFRGKVWLFAVAMLLLPQVINHNSSEVTTASTAPAKAAEQQHSVASRHHPDHPLYAFKQADQRVGSIRTLPETFPYELPWAIAQYWQARQAVAAVRANLKEPDAHLHLQGLVPQADLLVFVVGESSTRNAWRVFEPTAAATTPRLEARQARGEALYLYGRTLAQTTSTRQALPSMLTAQPIIWPNAAPNPQATRSIVSVAAQAGYATAWFSNQTAVGEHDGIIASYAQEAANIAFLNPATFQDQGSHDAVLLPALRRHLQQHQRAFVVLHTLGSHFTYSHRYPAGFGPFPQPQSEREHYYNSVAYTDWFLNEVMQTLADDGRSAALVFASDHGEAVPGGDCKAESAARTTRDAYEVPALVWLSPAYAQAQMKTALRLQANQNHPYTVAASHATLLDLMRGDAFFQPRTDAQISSFAQAPLPPNAMGQAPLPLWHQKFEQAKEKNPCFMLLR